MAELDWCNWQHTGHLGSLGTRSTLVFSKWWVVIIIRQLYRSYFITSGTELMGLIDHPVSEIETRTEALAFDSFTETIRGNIPYGRSNIRSVCRLEDERH
jgi:hypothetical protein